MSLFQYPNQRYTSQIGLALYGMEELLAENFLLIDSAFSAGGTVNVNGSLVNSPNFNGTLPVAPLGNTLVSFQTDINGNVSAYAPTSAPGGNNLDVQYNDNGVFGGGGNGGLLFTYDKTTGQTYLGYPQSTLNPIIQGFQGQATIATIAPTGINLPGQTLSLQGDGTVQRLGKFCQILVEATNTATHFHAGGFYETTITVSPGQTQGRCIGQLVAVTHAGGGGTVSNLIGLDLFGNACETGAIVTNSIGLYVELQFGVYSGNGGVDPSAVYGMLLNNPGPNYHGPVYYGCLIGGGGASSVTLATANYGLYVDNSGFNGANDYGLYLQASKAFIGGSLVLNSTLTDGAASVGTSGQLLSSTGTGVRWAAQLAFAAPTLTVGLAGTSSGILALTGSTSGTATITAPAVAGTVTNQIVISNGLGVPNGTAGGPSYSFSGATAAGTLYDAGSASVAFATGGAFRAGVNSVYLGVSSGLVIGWGSGTIISTNPDAAFSRLGPASVAVGNGTAGDVTGNLSFNRISRAGSDYAGQATVTAGNTTKAVAFAVNYAGTGQPVVVLTPTSDPLALGVPVGWWVTYTGSAGAWSGFVINVQTALAGNIVFNYAVIGVA